MKYTVEFDIKDFEFWSGGKDTFDEYVRQDRLSELEQMIEDNFSGTIPTKTEINDFVWFDDRVNSIFDEEDEEDEE